MIFYILVAMLVGYPRDICPVFGLSKSVRFFEVEFGLNAMIQGNIGNTQRSV
jgi:hypothetical protein